MVANRGIRLSEGGPVAAGNLDQRLLDDGPIVSGNLGNHRRFPTEVSDFRAAILNGGVGNFRRKIRRFSNPNLLVPIMFFLN
ncbi:hypothetical protein LINGRAHAP2_LOCUS7391 [Linum grandiflorum]